MVGDIDMGFNFSPRFQKPFTDREVVLTLADRDAMPLIQRYNLMVVKTEDSGNSYILRVGYNSLDPGDNENWRPYANDSFLSLADTPASYAGSAGMAIVVNPGEDGLIYKNIAEDHFLKTDHVVTTRGSVDAGKPVILTQSGLISSTMMAIESGFHFQGQWTPTALDEYPDPTGLPFGSFWDIAGVDEAIGYEFTTGSLVGQTIYNGNLLLLGQDGWNIKVTEFNPSAYYKLDGLHHLQNDFQAGGYKLVNIAPGTADTDGVAISQIAGFLNKSGGEMTGNLFISTADAQRVIFLDSAGEVAGTVYHSDTTGQVVLARYETDGLTIASQVVLGEACPFITGADGGYPVMEFDQDLITKKYHDDSLAAHTTATDNPHSVTAEHVGLENVDNTSDELKPISIATQAALDGKAESTHSHTESEISDLDKYTTSEVDTLLGEKSDTGHTHAEYATLSGDNVYTGTQTAVDYVPTSDIRRKRDVKKLKKGIDGLEAVSFRMKDREELMYGFIAQTMLKTHPELVRGSEKEFYSIAINSISAMTVMEVQKLKRKEKKQKKQIKKLLKALKRLNK